MTVPSKLSMRYWALLVAVAAPSALGSPALAEAEDTFVEERRRMVATIEAIAADTVVAGRSRIAGPVLDAMARVPRHRFVPERARASAYEDRPLPIGYGQTISQPYIVALMTDLLDLSGDEAVLEVGTGSGYQAAILGELAGQTYTIEIIPELARRAEDTLDDLGYANVTVRQGDGYYGWPEHGPFDAIVVTAAASHIPPPLIGQLRPGGRMIIPVGGPFFVQQLMMVLKTADGGIRTRHLLPVRFVPLTGDH